MQLQRWRAFQEAFPGTAQKMEPLGARLYGLGAEKGASAPELNELCSLLSDNPDAAEMLCRCSSPSREDVLRVVFLLGAQILLSLEGKQ